MAKLADPKRAKNLAWFFKTGPGEYGEGDQFLGLTVPLQRKVARRFLHLSLTDIAHLLRSPIHEHRFTAAEILVAQYERASPGQAEKIFRFYLKHAKRFNNWDLVDTSGRYIVGEHLRNRPRDVLYRLAKSRNIWGRRIVITSTFAFLKNGQLDDTFRIAELLLGDKA
jgi:3-methyladenine DNA glycosylase AlkD